MTGVFMHRHLIGMAAFLLLALPQLASAVDSDRPMEIFASAGSGGVVQDDLYWGRGFSMEYGGLVNLSPKHGLGLRVTRQNGLNAAYLTNLSQQSWSAFYRWRPWGPRVLSPFLTLDTGFSGVRGNGVTTGTEYDSIHNFYGLGGGLLWTVHPRWILRVDAGWTTSHPTEGKEFVEWYVRAGLHFVF